MEVDADICTIPFDNTREIQGHELEADKAISTVPLNDTVETDGHELEEDLENAYVEDTEDQDAPDSREYLRASIVDDHVPKDIVFDSDEQEAEQVGCISSVKNKEKICNKWKLNTLVYRRKRRKNADVGVKDAVLGSVGEIEVVGCASASQSLEETNNKWKLNTLVYRRQSKTVSVSEHSIQSLASAEKATTEGSQVVEKHVTVSSHASEIGIHSLDEKIRHSHDKIYNKDVRSLECKKKMRHFAVVCNADRFASSHCKTKHGDNDVPRQICLKEFGLGGDSVEPKRPSHMNALDFVDYFLSVNDLNIPENQKNDGQSGVMVKSPPEFSVKGVQTLAKRAYLAAKPRDIAIFDWDEIEMTECNAVKVSNEEEFEVRSLGQSPEKDGSETQIIADTCDFGYDTQMAAEAMEALMYAPPPNISPQYAQEFPKDEVGNLSEVAPKSKKSQTCTNFEMPGSVSQINQKQVQNTSPKNSTKSNHDVFCPLKTHSGYKNESSSPSHPKNIVTRREPLAANSVQYRKPIVVKKFLVGKNLRLISQQQVDKNLERENSEGAGTDRIFSKFPHIQQHREDMIVQKFRKSSSGTKRNRCKPLERISEVCKTPIHSSKRNISNSLKLNVAKKRTETDSDVNIHRTSERRVLNSIFDESLGIISKRTQLRRRNSGLLCSSTLLKLEPWCLKKKKRTHKGVPRHCKGSINSSTLLRVIDDEQIEKYPVKPPKCTAGPLPSSHAESLSYPKTRPLEKVPKHNIQEKNISDPLPNSIPRQLRKRRNDTLSILFSQHLDPKILNQQKKIIARLGFAVARCCSDATHFVTDRFVRTRNMLEAISLGKPVVTHLWLERCGQANCFVDEKPFILRDAEKEKEIGFSMAVTLAHACKHPLLMGLRVFITPNVKPGVEMIQSLVKLVHGKVVKRIPKTEWNGGLVPNDLLILSCKEDYGACVSLIDKGVAIYDTELLLNGIVIQRLDLERHQLLGNHAQDITRKRVRNSTQH